MAVNWGAALTGAAKASALGLLTQVLPSISAVPFGDEPVFLPSAAGLN